MPVIPLGEIFTAGIPAIFAQLASRGWTLDREHTVVRGFPVQWLETSGLTEEAVREAQPTEFDGEPGRVFRAEHPVAIAACADG